MESVCYLDSWLNSLFKKGYRQSLEESDIYEVLPRDSTEYLTNKLKRFWDHEVRTSKKPSLLLPLIKLAGKRYFLLAFLVLIELTLRLVQPIFIGKIVGVFQQGLEDKENGYIAAAVIALCACAELIIRHPVFLQMQRCGVNLRVATSSLIYQKALRMSQASFSFTNTGQIVNLLSDDVQRIEEATHFTLYLSVGQLLLAVACYLIWREIGYSFIPGMLLLFLLTPLQSWLGRRFASLRAKTAVLRDERIKIMNEIICGMRVIKMYAWEYPFAKLLGKARRKETQQILRTSRLYSLNASFYLSAIPLVTMVMFIPYVLSGNTLTSDKVFTVVAIIACVNIISSVYVAKGITALKESSVSLKRVERFLLLDEGPTLAASRDDAEQLSVVVENVYSSWDKKSDDQALSGVSFEVSAGELLMVIGPVGCGKSSLLMALLRELPVTSGSIRVNGRVAYVSQQPWVFSGTLKENILFGKEYDKKKYDDVIRVCALEKDIESLIHGDKTLVGERGVSLSGGQKARVNLARAVYFDCSVYIMDDPLSAVDSHVGRHIFNECIRGILKSKVCILVSHQLQFLPEADRILCLCQGEVVGYGKLQSLKEEGIDVMSMVQMPAQNDDNNDFIGKKSEDPVVFSETLERRLFHSSSKRKRKNRFRKQEDTQSLFGFSPESDPLLDVNEHTLNVQYQAKSAHDFGRHSGIVPDVAFLSSASCDASGSSASSLLDEDTLDDQYAELQEDGNKKAKKKGAESRKSGQITLKVYKEYLLAGARPVFLFLSGFLFLCGQAFLMVCEWWLAKWSDWEESTLDKNDSRTIVDDERVKNISIYVGLVVLVFAVGFVRAVIFFHILIRASRRLHDLMFNAILRAPIYFFDTNPVGRILNRFSKDMSSMDDRLPMTFFDAFQLSVLATSIILMSISSQPYSAVAVVPVIAVFLWLRGYYIKSSRALKRLEAFSRSPLYSHISATLQGLTTIRALKEQQQFIDIYNKFQDHNTSAAFLYLACTRWLGFRLDFLCAVLMITVTVAPFLASAAGLSVNPILVGLSLLYTKRLTGMFQFCVRQTAEVENQMVSVERVQEYTVIEPEAELELVDKKPPDDWPEHGEIFGENVRFCYHPSLPTVLKDISFNIKAKEKIGIVGRTGAGKSSLVSALFRMAEPSGILKIDGLSITEMGLHDLRERLSIIPQDPVIFAGSVRSNLDPFSSRTDLELWDALQQVQLKEVVDNYPEKFEFLLTESGKNLSVGQRQLICLARAILRHNKILIIDEATANVDHRTDSLIQKTIRERFEQCTVLTIAHRLNTIMDADRIMILDDGKVIEFEEPFELLKRPESHLSVMVNETGKEMALQLYKTARIAHERRISHR